MNAIMFFGLLGLLASIFGVFWLVYMFGYENGLKRGLAKGSAIGLSRGFELYRQEKTESPKYKGLSLSPLGHEILHTGKGF